MRSKSAGGSVELRYKDLKTSNREQPIRGISSLLYNNTSLNSPSKKMSSRASNADNQKEELDFNFDDDDDLSVPMAGRQNKFSNV